MNHGTDVGSQGGAVCLWRQVPALLRLLQPLTQQALALLARCKQGLAYRLRIVSPRQCAVYRQTATVFGDARYVMNVIKRRGADSAQLHQGNDMQEQTLQGKVALVTGGARGLGAATARALAALGADVALTYVSSEAAAHALVSELQDMGVRALAIHNDQAETFLA